MKSANRFRIVEQYESYPGTYYIVQELSQNRRGTRSKWSSFIVTWIKLKEAQDFVERIIRERNFIPRVVKEIDAVAVDPDYAAALKEMEKEGIGI